ncbi:MAG: CHAD domain-containing protein [Synechococcales bacterium]|nr:CHAD domain-containing protein [Synechococcales bacterium]
MSYRLSAQESLSQGVQRIAYEQIDASIHELTEKIKGDRGKAIHQARKHFKKLRALVRLVRDDLGKDIYHQENACFRDAGRELAAVRDAQVRLETLDDLREHYQDSLDAGAFHGLRQTMANDYAAVRQEVLDDDDAIASVVTQLQLARDRIEQWPIGDKWSAIADSLQRVYQRGYADFRQAGDQPTPKHLHEWRKRVKYLWYHFRLLARLWPDLFKPLRKQTKQLADYLGDDHDLAMLTAFLREQPERFNGAEDLGVAMALIQHRQLELQTKATFLGARLYAEDPKAFMKRMKVYWQIWQRQRQQPAIPMPQPSEFIHDLPAVLSFDR